MVAMGGGVGSTRDQKQGASLAPNSHFFSPEGGEVDQSDIQDVFLDIETQSHRLVQSVRRVCASLGRGMETAEPLRDLAVRLALQIQASGPAVDPAKLSSLSRELRATLSLLAETEGDIDDPYCLGDMSATMGDETDEG